MRLLAAPHARFVAEYLKDHNGTRAAIRAGFARKSAHVRAHRLKRRPEVSAAIAATVHRRDRRSERIAAQMLEELCRIAFLDPRRFYYPAGHRKAGRLKPLAEMDDDVRACVANMTVGGVRPTRRNHRRRDPWSHRIRAVDKVKALQMLYRHLACATAPITATSDWDRLLARLQSVRTDPASERSRDGTNHPTAAPPPHRLGRRQPEDPRRYHTKRHRFVREYLKDLNGAKAAVRAGFAATHSKGTARRLLQREDVQEAIAAGEQRHVASAGLSRERVVQELARIASCDAGRLFYPAGHGQANQLMPLHLMDADTAACVATYAVAWTHRGPDRTRYEMSSCAIRCWDKVKALGLLWDHVRRQTIAAAENRQWEELAARVAEIRRQPRDAQQYLTTVREGAAPAQGQPGDANALGHTAPRDPPALAGPLPTPTARLDRPPLLMVQRAGVLPAASACPTRVGVCLSCQHGQRLASPHTPVLCRRRLRGDFRYPKYPDVSMRSCGGYERA